MRDRHEHGWTSLGIGVSTILIVWMLVLPRVGAWKPVRARIEYLDRQGVDPAALYYTDLDAMTKIEADITTIRQTHPDAFWSVRSIADK